MKLLIIEACRGSIVTWLLDLSFREGTTVHNTSDKFHNPSHVLINLCNVHNFMQFYQSKVDVILD